MYTNIHFLAGSWETNKRGVKIKHFYPENKFEAVLINVSQKKRIVTTEIQGCDGTIKEYIGLDDYHVTVNGVITGKNRQRPVQEIAALKKMLDSKALEGIDVACAYLENLGIYSLVVESYELGEKEGGYSYQAFSINFLSEIPQELQMW